MNNVIIFRDNWKEIVTQECLLKGYSQKTIRNYVHHTEKFISSNKTPREYLLSLIENGKSDETVRSTGFAIKFYLTILKKDSSEILSVLNDLPNVKREKKLPIVLSKEEIESMIKSTKNINHRLIIQVGYSDISTTLIYTKVSNRALSKIKSPLGD